MPLRAIHTFKGLCYLAASIALAACAPKTATSNELIVVGAIRGWLNSPATYLVEVDGSGEADGDIPRGVRTQPEWSPDGVWVISSTFYSSWSLRDSRIYLTRIEDGYQVQVPTGTGGSYDATWAPDGTHIAYYSHAEGEIQVMDIGCLLREETCSSTPQVVARGGQPDWSPDGKYLVYQSEHPLPLGEIYVVPSEAGGTPTMITQKLQDCFDPDWSPNGEKIVMRCDDGIYVIESDGSNATRIETGRGSVMPTWSPSGDKIAYVSMRDHHSENIGLANEVPTRSVFLMNPDGSEITRLILRNDEHVTWFAWYPINNQ